MDATVANAFDLHPDGPGRFLASSIGDPERHDVVFGGQILAQVVLASAAAGPEGKLISSVHTVFARAATLTRPLEIEVDTAHDGRTVGSATVTVRQGDRLCARALVLHQADGGDVIGHGPPAPDLGAVEDARPAAGTLYAGLVAPGTEVRIVGGVDTWDPDSPTGPAELGVWLRLPSSPGGPVGARALLAYATDGFLIGTALRPHAGFGQAMAHGALDTGVLSHTVTFHAQPEPETWLLMVNEGTWAGQGRAFGRGQIFDGTGSLVASFVQESLIRQGRNK